MTWDNKQPVTKRITVPTPAAGADWSQVANTGSTWLIRGGTFTLATDANVATRTILLRAQADTQTWFQTSDGFGQAASTTVKRFWFQGSQPIATSGAALAFAWPSDGLVLPNGHTLSTLTGSIQVGDQYSAIVLDVLELPETYPDWWMPVANLVPYTWKPNDDPRGGY